MEHPNSSLQPNLLLLSANGIRAVGRGAIVGIGEDSFDVEAFEEEDGGACAHFEACGHPDGVTNAGLLQNDVRTALDSGNE